MFGFGQTELIIFLIIVLIIFGPKNLPKLASALGRSARELKNGLNGVTEDIKQSMNTDEPAEKRQARPPQEPEPGVRDAEPVDRDATDKAAHTSAEPSARS